MQPVLTRFSSKGVERHLDVGERSRHCLLELYSVRGDSHLHSIHWKRGNKGPERVRDLFKNTQEVFWVQACAGQQSQSVIPLPNSLTGGNPWVTRSRPQRKASPHRTQPEPQTATVSISQRLTRTHGSSSGSHVRCV